jgi:hypothetical protein
MYGYDLTYRDKYPCGTSRNLAKLKRTPEVALEWMLCSMRQLPRPLYLTLRRLV